MVCLVYRARGLIVPIIRPVVYRAERLGVFANSTTGLPGWRDRGGNNRCQLLDVEDLTTIYLTLTLPRGEVSDAASRIGAEEFTTMKGDYQVVLDHAGHGKKIVGFPAAPVVGLRVLDKLKVSRFTVGLRDGLQDSFVSIEKAKNSATPKYSNKDAS